MPAMLTPGVGQGGDLAQLFYVATAVEAGSAGADAMAGVEQNLVTIHSQIDANRDLSATLSYGA